MPVSEAAVATLVGTVREAALAEDMPAAIIAGAHALLGVDYVTYDEIGPRGAATVASPPNPNAIEAFARCAHEHPAVVRQRETGELTTFRLSDLATYRALQRLELWSEVFRPLGIRYQLSLPLHVSESRIVGVGLSRKRRDFSDAEVGLVELLRRGLAPVVALRESPPAEQFARLGLTEREAQVAALATRYPTRQAAVMLGISERTVEKHLENAFRKVGVRTRAALRAAAESRYESYSDRPRR